MRFSRRNSKVCCHEKNADGTTGYYINITSHLGNLFLYGGPWALFINNLNLRIDVPRENISNKISFGFKSGKYA